MTLPHQRVPYLWCNYFHFRTDQSIPIANSEDDMAVNDKNDDDDNDLFPHLQTNEKASKSNSGVSLVQCITRERTNVSSSHWQSRSHGYVCVLLPKSKNMCNWFTLHSINEGSPRFVYGYVSSHCYRSPCANGDLHFTASKSRISRRTWGFAFTNPRRWCEKWAQLHLWALKEVA